MIIAIDTGGTKTLIAQFNQDGTLGKVLRFPTPADVSDYVALVRDMLQQHFSDTPVDAIAIALPGIIKNGVAIWCNNLGWKNFDAQAAFQGVLGDVPIFIENDANLAGLAETHVLDPIPVSSLYITISTGIGTGFITNGHIDPGLRLSEGGRMLVEFGGKMREWESFASGKAVYNTYGKFAREIHDPKIWNQVADRISRGLLVAIPLAQPDIIIFGGSIGTQFHQFSHSLTKLLKERLPPYIACPNLVQAAHPEQAVLYGCYYYALDNPTNN